MSPDVWKWLAPTLMALFLYGFGQALVKKYVDDVPPARYCLFFFFAKSLVNLGYFASQHGTDFGAGMSGITVNAMATGTLAYVLEGLGWICYYESIVTGPVSIVGTLSAAYAAPTVIFSRFCLGEQLLWGQYAGVALVISGCVGLGYAPPDPNAKITSHRWIPLGLAALVFWGAWQTTVKHTYMEFKVSETQMAMCNILGAFLTLGLYGLIWGRRADAPLSEWTRSFLPMAVMAGGDLGVLIGTKFGTAALVTTLSGAYPVVTLSVARVMLGERITRVQWGCVALVVTGMFLSMPEFFQVLAAMRGPAAAPSPAP